MTSDPALYTRSIHRASALLRDYKSLVRRAECRLEEEKERFAMTLLLIDCRGTMQRLRDKTQKALPRRPMSGTSRRRKQ